MKTDVPAVGRKTVVGAADFIATSDHAPRNVQVEIIQDKVTDEQRAALRRFMDWYRSKVIIDEAIKTGSPE